MSASAGRTLSFAAAVAGLYLTTGPAAARDGAQAEVQPDPGGASGVVRGQIDIDAAPEVV